MLQHLRPAVSLLALLTLVTGVAYPLAVTGAAQLLLPAQANGSLIEKDGKLIGSALIGQNFADARYFHGRPSATSAPDPADAARTVDAPYNAASSGAANLGPTSRKLIDRIKADADAMKAAGHATPLPADALTTSASGLDPHISPANAAAQAPAVAKARGLPLERVTALVAARTQGRTLGVFGEPRVNVLALNMALDALK
jgi:K+-transporting ATPase ATPase C chain